MTLLICPPVTPFSSPDEIRAWLAELAMMHDRYADDPSALASVAFAGRDAAEMLRLALEVSQGGEPAPIVVTPENFEALLVASAQQAAAIHRGEQPASRVVSHVDGVWGDATWDVAAGVYRGRVRDVEPAILYEAATIDGLKKALAASLADAELGPSPTGSE